MGRYSPPPPPPLRSEISFSIFTAAVVRRKQPRNAILSSPELYDTSTYRTYPPVQQDLPEQSGATDDNKKSNTRPAIPYLINHYHHTYILAFLFYEYPFSHVGPVTNQTLQQQPLGKEENRWSRRRAQQRTHPLH